MGYVIPIYFFALFFAAFSCGLPKEKPVQKFSPDSVEHMVIKQDTIPNVTPLPPGLAPNTMRVKGKLLKIYPSEDDKTTSIELKIQQILGVGSATPAVAPSDALLIRVSSLPDTLKKGAEFVCIISHHQVIGQQKKKSTPWQLERIENEQGHN